MNREGKECHGIKGESWLQAMKVKIGYEWDQEAPWKEDHRAFLEVWGMVSDSDITFLLGLSFLGISKFIIILWTVVDI